MVTVTESFIFDGNKHLEGVEMQLKAKAKALVDSTKCQFTASKTSLCIICDLICREC